jgi:hypothetical protein
VSTLAAMQPVPPNDSHARARNPLDLPSIFDPQPPTYLRRNGTVRHRDRLLAEDNARQDARETLFERPFHPGVTFAEGLDALERRASQNYAEGRQPYETVDPASGEVGPDQVCIELDALLEAAGAFAPVPVAERFEPPHVWPRRLSVHVIKWATRQANGLSTAREQRRRIGQRARANTAAAVAAGRFDALKATGRTSVRGEVRSNLPRDGAEDARLTRAQRRHEVQRLRRTRHPRLWDRLLDLAGSADRLIGVLD